LTQNKKNCKNSTERLAVWQKKKKKLCMIKDSQEKEKSKQAGSFQRKGHLRSSRHDYKYILIKLNT